MDYRISIKDSEKKTVIKIEYAELQKLVRSVKYLYKKRNGGFTKTVSTISGDKQIINITSREFDSAFEEAVFCYWVNTAQRNRTLGIESEDD